MSDDNVQCPREADPACAVHGGGYCQLCGAFRAYQGGAVTEPVQPAPVNSQGGPVDNPNQPAPTN